MIYLKDNFIRKSKALDGLKLQCNFCRSDYKKKYYYKNHDYHLVVGKNSQNRGKINEYIKNKMKTDLTFNLACYMRNWLYKAYKAQNVGKTKKTFDLLKCSHSFFRRRIIHQFYRDMSVNNYGSVWYIDHCLPLATFSLLDEKQMNVCFNWINLRPMFTKETTLSERKLIIDFT